jgi:hypothetical protein
LTLQGQGQPGNLLRPKASNFAVLQENFDLTIDPIDMIHAIVTQYQRSLEEMATPTSTRFNMQQAVIKRDQLKAAITDLKASLSEQGMTAPLQMLNRELESIERTPYPSCQYITLIFAYSTFHRTSLCLTRDASRDVSPPFARQ